MDFWFIFKFFSHIAFVLIVGYYSITALQWYSYKLQRVVFHYNRYDWHLLFFVVPIFVYYLAADFFWYYFYILYVPTFVLWLRKLVKKLIFTARVKRFFLFLFFATIFQNILCLQSDFCMNYGVLLPLFATLFLSMLFERFTFEGYKKQAKQKLQDREDIIIFAITGSYGKTSMKNYLYQILSLKYKCYMTPRSVNTLAGIIKDINDDLPSDCEIYIVEAGARLQGDIDAIARFLNPHYCIIGKIGEQHIEYFKTLENIRNTKMELLNSKRLKKAFVHKSANVKADTNTLVFGIDLDQVSSNLDGITFKVEVENKEEMFHAPLLGAFNADNILACIHAASDFLKIDTIKQAVNNLQGAPHRLQKIQSGGKLIIDDSYNGNFEGMKSSFELVASYSGRKVLVTPGIVESTEEANISLAKVMDSIFDLVIITGKTNRDSIKNTLLKCKNIILEDKNKMEEVLAEYTQNGDLILFSNDTPDYM